MNLDSQNAQVISPAPTAKRGGARPGAGRPKGPSKIQRYLRSLENRPLRPHRASNVLDCIDEWELWSDLLTDPDPWLRLKAAMYLTDRREGKAVQKIDVQSLNVSISAKDVERAREVAKEIAGTIRALDNSTEYLLSDASDANSNVCKVLDAVEVGEQTAKPDASMAESLPASQQSPDQDGPA